MKSLSVSLLVLCAAGAARAEAPLTPAIAARAPLTLTLRADPPLGPDQGFREMNRGRSVGGVIATDALYGGLIGIVIGVGVALIDNDFNNGGWGRDVAVGAGVGLIAGGIFGAVDVVSYSDRYQAEVNRSQRGRGFGEAAGMRSSF